MEIKTTQEIYDLVESRDMPLVDNWVRVDDVTNELFRFRNEFAELMIRFQRNNTYDLLRARELLLQMDEFILNELSQSTPSNLHQDAIGFGKLSSPDVREPDGENRESGVSGRDTFIICARCNRKLFYGETTVIWNGYEVHSGCEEVRKKDTLIHKCNKCNEGVITNYDSRGHVIGGEFCPECLKHRGRK